jgi:tRNA(Ile)-lysidine synthase
LIQDGQSELFHPIHLKFDIINREELVLSKSKQFAFVDLEKLEFPLTLRKWKAGDFFVPFGMKGKKKLSDFLIDEKLSLLEKQNVWVLECGEEIVWVVGMRISEKYRMFNLTEKVFKVSCF